MKENNTESKNLSTYAYVPLEEVKQKSNKKRILFTSILILIVGIIAFLANTAYKYCAYNNSISFICADEYDKAEYESNKLPDDYRDIDNIKSYLVILQLCENNQKVNYNSVLNSLSKLDSFEDSNLQNHLNTFTNKTRKQIAQDIINQIDKLPSDIEQITLGDEQDVSKIRADYNACDTKTQGLVSNIDILLAAEEKIEILKQYRDQAQKKVSDMIDDIGTVTLESESDIAAALSAYKALPKESKQLVDNKDTLTEAKKTLEQLQKEQEAKEQAAKEREEQARAKKENNFDSLQNSDGDSESSSGSHGTVYWVSSGKVYHTTRDCPTLSRSKVIHSGAAPSGRRACKVCS